MPDVVDEGQGDAALPEGVRARFAELTTQRREAIEQRDALQARVTELEGAHQATTAESTDLRERLGLARLGLLDDEAVDVARVLYGRLPDDARPEGGLPAWLQGLRSQEAAVPRALAPYLQHPPPQQAASAPASPEPPQPVTPAAPAAAPPSVAAPAPAPKPHLAPPQAPATGGAQVTAEQLRAAREAAQRSGDWSAFNKLASGVRR